MHRAGEKLFVDYAGQKPRIVDRSTGEEREVELFVATLGASSFTYAEATVTQRVADFIGSHTRALEPFGVPELVIPDQLKSGVTRACRYDIVQSGETPFQVLKESGKRAESRSYLWALYGGPREQSLLIYTYDLALDVFANLRP